MSHEFFLPVLIEGGGGLQDQLTLSSTVVSAVRAMEEKSQKEEMESGGRWDNRKVNSSSSGMFKLNQIR
jgi:hypothetical protein